MLKILPLLTDPAGHGGYEDDAFDVVVPSLPGYGFSDRPKEPRVFLRIPDLWVRLMEGLGYRRFGAHGGDIAAYVNSRLGQDYPERVIGLHLTALAEHVPGPDSPEFTEWERAFLEERGRWFEAEGAYSHLQTTKPQTLAYGLNDSPVALIAWILEKYRAWSDSGGDVESRFSKDYLLANVTLYWATQTVASSARFYHECVRPEGVGGEAQAQ